MGMLRGCFAEIGLHVESVNKWQQHDELLYTFLFYFTTFTPHARFAPSPSIIISITTTNYDDQ